MKVNICMAHGPEALVAATVMIFDHVIPAIVKISISANLDVIYAPYCQADEVTAAVAAGVEQATESLDSRVNHSLYADCVCPKIRARIKRLMDWAAANGYDPEAFKASRLFQDGEGGPLNNIIDHFAEEFRAELMGFAKLPNALTAKVQIGDRTGAHPGIHKAFESADFKNMTDETVEEIAGRMPGLKRRLTF